MKTSEKQNRKKHIVIVGGGFAGLNFAKKISNSKYYQVTVVDKNNFNYFTPLLYQVATGYLDPASISYPFRMLFRNKGISFRMGEVKHVDTNEQRLFLDSGDLPYDYLVFAAGSKTNFFGNSGLKEKVISLKGINDALHMRNELLKTMEKAAVEQDPDRKSVV